VGGVTGWVSYLWWGLCAGGRGRRGEGTVGGCGGVGVCWCAVGGGVLRGVTGVSARLLGAGWGGEVWAGMWGGW